MSLSKMLVAKHAKLAAFVLPTSVAFGFAYTATYGTNPVEDMKNVAVGSSGESRIINVRLGALGGQPGNRD